MCSQHRLVAAKTVHGEPGADDEEHDGTDLRDEVRLAKCNDMDPESEPADALSPAVEIYILGFGFLGEAVDDDSTGSVHCYHGPVGEGDHQCDFLRHLGGGSGVDGRAVEAVNVFADEIPSHDDRERHGERVS